MQRLGIRVRIFVFTLAVLLAFVAVEYAYLSSQTRREVSERIQQDLRRRAAMAAHRVGAERRMPLPIEWDSLADELGQLSAARVTLIALDGVVLGDSSVPIEAVPNIDNHADRPEVLQALQRGDYGISQRYSETVEQMMLYIAAPWREGEELRGTVRLSLPLTDVEAAIGQLRRSATFAALAAVLVSLLVAMIAAQLGSRAARGLTRIAEQMSAGDLTVRSHVRGSDEFATLGRTLDGLAANLSATLNELVAEKDRLDRVLSSMHEGVLLVDEQGQILLHNSAAMEMLFLGPGQVGKSLQEVLEHPELLGLVQQALSGNSETAEIEISTPSPRTLLADVRRLPLSGGALAVFVDVTEQRRLETVRQEFVANASHELRTPVAAILSAVETLQGAAKGDPEAASGFISMIARNAQRLRALVDDLLSLSLIESGKLEISLAPVTLRHTVEAILNNFIDPARKKGVELVCLVPSALVVRASSRGLEHVLGNLIDNALKYCPNDSRIVVQAARERDKVVLSVSDNGPGIPEKHWERIFERFYRVDAGRSRALGGTGLGLSIVRHWVEAMEGRIRVGRSEAGGAGFWVTLTAAERRPEELNTTDARVA